jgi:hypothetical protein
MAMLTAACAGSAPPAVQAGPADCRAVDSAAGHWLATIFIDGVRVGDHLAARLEQIEPETFELTDPEPPRLAALRPETIDLLQFSRGPDAERALGLCPGYVAWLLTTKPAR